MHDSARKADSRTDVARTIGILLLLAGILFAAGLCTASPLADNPVPNIFQPRSSPAESIYHLSVFVLAITAVIFLAVFSLLVYVVLKFRTKVPSPDSEQAQVYGST